MRTRNILRCKDHYCSYDFDEEGLICTLHPWGDEDNENNELHEGEEQIEVRLPYHVALRRTRNLRHWLNQHCEGWYFCDYEDFWFEKDTDAFQAMIVHGAPPNYRWTRHPA